MILQHGTTLARAAKIFCDGPDRDFVEPDRISPAGGFSTAPLGGPYPMGAPVDYALSKAELFQDEGGPAIVEISVPEDVVEQALVVEGEVCFSPGMGLEELIQVWSKASIPTLNPKIVSKHDSEA